MGGAGRRPADNLLIRPVARWPWQAASRSRQPGSLTLAGLAAGPFTWLEAVHGDAALAFARPLAAGLNAVPAAILVLGVGTLAHGVAPRFASGVAYGLVTCRLVVRGRAGPGQGCPGSRTPPLTGGFGGDFQRGPVWRNSGLSKV